jgi:hypothetical protein
MAGNPGASLEDIYNAFPELLDGGEENEEVATEPQKSNDFQKLIAPSV